jgi:hypothetical protein
MWGLAAGLLVHLLKIQSEQLSAGLQMSVGGSHCPAHLHHIKICQYQMSPYLTVTLLQNN